MFTVEIRINGALLGVIYGHNEGAAPPKKGEVDPCHYTWRYHDIESDTGPLRGSLVHERRHGLNALVRRIMADMQVMVDGEAAAKSARPRKRGR